MPLFTVLFDNGREEHVTAKYFHLTDQDDYVFFSSEDNPEFTAPRRNVLHIRRTPERDSD